VHQKLASDRNLSDVYTLQHARTIELAHKALARLYRPFDMAVGYTATLSNGQSVSGSNEYLDLEIHNIQQKVSRMNDTGLTCRPFEGAFTNMSSS